MRAGPEITSRRCMWDIRYQYLGNGCAYSTKYSQAVTNTNWDPLFRIGDGVYEVSVETRAGDNVWTLVRRGLSGIDVLGQAEAEMKTKHNIKPAKQETKSF